MKTNRNLILIFGLSLLFGVLNINILLFSGNNIKKQNSIKVSDLRNIKDAVAYLKTKEPFNAQNLSGSEATNSANQPNNLKMEILNGSGIPNQTTKVKDLLNKLPLDLTTENTAATSSTTLKYKTGVPAITKDNIKLILIKDYPLITEGLLTNSDTFDIILIIGK